MRLVKLLEKEISRYDFENGKQILNHFEVVLRTLQKNSSKLAALAKGDLGELLNKILEPFGFSAFFLNQLKTQIYNRKFKELLANLNQCKREWFRTWNKSLILIEVPRLELKNSDEVISLVNKIKPRFTDVGEVSFRYRKSLLGGFRVFFDFEVVDVSFANILNQIYNQIR